jgi:hypothetical protein
MGAVLRPGKLIQSAIFSPWPLIFNPMDAKTQLLEAIAGKNRGLLVSDQDRVAILSAVEKLEDHNPHPHPLAEKNLLDGNWRLLYTSSRSILGLDRLPLIQLGQIYQYLDVAQSQVVNLAEIEGIPFLEGLVAVVASFKTVSPKRIEVKFERSIIGLQRLLNYQSPLQFVQQVAIGKRFLPVDFNLPSRSGSAAWLETTYLDNDLRISRGNEGNVFVLSKG